MIHTKVDKWESPLTKWFDEELFKRRKVIPVQQVSLNEPITVQVKEEDSLAFCNHAGAELELIERDSMFANWHTGEIEMRDDYSTAIACDKCSAWQDEEGEWYE